MCDCGHSTEDHEPLDVGLCWAVVDGWFCKCRRLLDEQKETGGLLRLWPAEGSEVQPVQTLSVG